MATIVKAPNGKWRVQIRRRGHAHRSHYADTKAEAQRWARAQEARMDQMLAPEPARLTFQQVLDAYLEHYTPRGTVPGALTRLGKRLGKLRLTEISALQIIEYTKQRGVGPATTLMDLGHIGTVLKHGAVLVGAPTVAQGALLALQQARTTLRHTGAAGPPQERDRRPTQAELEALERASEPWRVLDMWSIVKFAIATCMRLGEICRITYEDYDPQTRTIVIRDRKHPRDKKDQRVPLLRGPFIYKGEVVDPVELMGEGHGRVCPHSTHSISTTFHRCCLKAGVDDLRFHDLRHDGISRMFEAGYDIPQVAVVSGHRDWKQLKRYTNIRPESLHRD